MTSPSTTHEHGWTADASTFGARLALVRQHMGWGNLKEAAVACGLPVESWRSWERDNREPSRLVTVAMAIATRTGCDLDWLIRGPQTGTIYDRTPEPNGRYAGTRVIAQIAPIGSSQADNGSVRPAQALRPPVGVGPTAKFMRRTLITSAN